MERGTKFALILFSVTLLIFFFFFFKSPSLKNVVFSPELKEVNIFSQNHLPYSLINVDSSGVDFGKNKETVFWQYKYANNSDIILISRQTHYCVWNSTIDEKYCELEVEIENRNPLKQGLNSFDVSFTISQNITPITYEYSNTYTYYNQTYRNKTINKTDNTSTIDYVTLKRRKWSKWQDLSKVVSMDTSKNLSIRAVFTMPKYASDTFNITVTGNLGLSPSLTRLTLDPNVAACGTLNQNNTVYNQTANLTTSGATCLTITGHNITFDMQGHNITSDMSGGGAAHGITQSIGDNITIKHGFIRGFDGIGIQLTGGENHTIKNMSITTPADAGFTAKGIVSDQKRTNITNVDMTMDGDDWIHLSSNADYSTIWNFTAAIVAAGGFDTIELNAVSHVVIKNVTSSGIFDGVEFFVPTNCTVIDSRITAGNAARFVGGTNNRIINSTLTGTGGGSNDLILSAGATKVNITNTTLINNGETVAGADWFYRKWYYKAYVNDSSGNAVNNMNVTARNTSGDVVFSTSTDATGYTPVFEIIEYKNDTGTTKWYSNYNISAVNTTHADSHSYNVTVKKNNLTGDIFTIAKTMNSTSTCMNITMSGQYILTADITDSANAVCINISTSDVVFDCQNNTIDGVFTDESKGILVNNDLTIRKNNVTLKNCILNNWEYGIHFVNVDNSSVYNMSLNQNVEGIYANNTNHNNFTNIIAFNNSRYGINFPRNADNNTLKDINATRNAGGLYLKFSKNNTLVNVTAINNTDGANFGFGLYIQRCENTHIYNSTFQENDNLDVDFTASTGECDHIFDAVNGSGGRAIEFYNSTAVNLTNQIYSELILCDADGSNLTNITVKGSDTKKNNILYLLGVDNANIKIINSSFNYYGIYATGTKSNFSDLIVSKNAKTGLYARVSNTSFENITAEYNDENGVEINYDDENNLTFVVASHNNKSGVKVWFRDPRANLIMNVIANNNSEYGVYLADGVNNTFENVSIANNTLAGLWVTDIHTYDASSFNTFRNFTIVSTYTDSYGVVIRKTNHSVFENFVITTNSSGAYGIFINSSQNNTFYNSTINASGENDIYMDEGNFSFVNVTFNFSDASFRVGSDSTMVVRWLYRAYVNNTLGNPMNSATVTANNNTGQTIATLTTDATGYTGYGSLIDFVQTAAGTDYYSEYNISATNVTYIDSHNYNVTARQNNLTGDIFTLGYSVVPLLSIVYPANTTYLENVSEMNYTYDDISNTTGGCWYSRDGGTTNSSAVNIGTNFTAVTSVEQTNNWTLYCNDSYNNLNQTSIMFYKETAGNITLCRNLSANTAYNLMNDISTTGSCLIIQGENITVDFNNYDLTGDNGSADYGIDNTGGYDNLTMYDGFIKNFGSGVHILDALYQNITNMTLYRNYQRGIYMDDSNLSTIRYVNSSDNDIYTVRGSPRGQGVYMVSNCNNNNITDSNLEAQSTDFRIEGNSYNNSLLNVSYTMRRVVTSTVYIKWYYKAYVNYTTGLPVNAATINATNVTGQLIDTLTTDATGWTGFGELTEFVFYSTAPLTTSYYSNYNISAFKSGYNVSSHSHNVTVQQNNLTDYFTIGVSLDAPVFDNLKNFSHLANTSFIYDLNATDSDGIDTFWFNDTNSFNITSDTGYIRNKTTLNYVRVYYINVSVNDTLNNRASAVFWISSKRETCSVISDTEIEEEIDKTEIPAVRLGDGEGVSPYVKLCYEVQFE